MQKVAADKTRFLNEMGKLQKVLNGEINPVEARIQAINELVNAVAYAPDDFIGFAPCPFGMDYRKTADWIETMIIKNHFRGTGELTFGTGNVQLIENIFKYIHDSSYDLPIWNHTFDPLTLNDIKAIADLAHRYPKTKVILGHGGGRHWIETIDPVKIPATFFDISAAYTIFSIKFAAQELPERCIFSSDLPYGDPCTGIALVDQLIKDTSVRNNIPGMNIRQLLKLQVVLF